MKLNMRAKLGKVLVHIKKKEDLRCFSEVIEKADEDKKVKVNALIKRGALHIQKCLGKSLLCQPIFLPIPFLGFYLLPRSTDTLSLFSKNSLKLTQLTLFNPKFLFREPTISTYR
jgi:hypothetical protein